MANVFDQFDTGAPKAVNVFDQFDTAAPAAGPPQAAEAAPAMPAPGASLADRLRFAVDNGVRTANQMFPIATPAAETLAHFASGAVAGPAAGVTGIASLPAGADTAANNTNAVNSALTYQPRTRLGLALTEGVGMPLQAVARGADVAGGYVAEKTGSPALGAAVNTGIQALPMLLLKGRGKAAEVGSDVTGTPPVGRSPAPGEGVQAPPVATPPGRAAGLAEVSEAAPTKEALKQAAQAAYKRADESGVVVTPESFNALKTKISDEMQQEGIDATLHPDSTAALKRITESDGELSLQQLETLRRIANDAEGSIKPADRRLAGKMVDGIDDYIDSLSEKDVVAGDATKAAALKEARDLYSRSKKAEELDRLVARAELSAPNFSVSGMENALRTEFRALAKNDNRMRRFTAEEQKAIRLVAKGAPVENTLRMLGKLAPTGSISTAISAGGGFAVGGPAGAIALPAAGAAARYAATRMTMRNVARANELVRRGPAQAPKSAKPAPTVRLRDIGNTSRTQ